VRGDGLVVLMVISGIGLGLSFIVHVLSVFSIWAPPSGLGMGLHWGGAVIIIPACIVSAQMRDRFGKKDFRKLIKSICPRWVVATLGLVLIYAVVSTVFHWAGNRTENSELRGLWGQRSGHWMAIYALAMLLFYARWSWKTRGVRSCPNGHIVAFEARRCEECGSRIGEEGAGSGLEPWGEDR